MNKSKSFCCHIFISSFLSFNLRSRFTYVIGLVGMYSEVTPNLYSLFKKKYILDTYAFEYFSSNLLIKFCICLLSRKSISFISLEITLYKYSSDFSVDSFTYFLLYSLKALYSLSKFISDGSIKKSFLNSTSAFCASHLESKPRLRYLFIHLPSLYIFPANIYFPVFLSSSTAIFLCPLICP